MSVIKKFWKMLNEPWTQNDCVWGMCKGPTGILAVGKKALVLSSQDGKTWKGITVPTLENLWSCVYSEFHKMYVVVGTHVILTSKDLVKWEAVEVKADQLFKVVALGKWLIAIDYTIGVWTSQDGKTWEQIGLKVDRNWRCLAAKGLIAYAGCKNGNTYKVFEKDDQVVIEKHGHEVDGSGACVISDTGIVWAAHTIRKYDVDLVNLEGETTILGGDIQGKNLFLVGSEGAVLFSKNSGDSWNYYSTGVKGNLNCCLVDGENLIIGGERIDGEWLAPLVYVPVSEMKENSEIPTPPAPKNLKDQIQTKLKNALNQLDELEILIEKL